jgi:prefoldin subunit 5
MFEWWRRSSYAKNGDVEDAFSTVDSRLEKLTKEYRQFERRVETLQQENANLKERLQALEDTVKTLKQSNE